MFKILPLCLGAFALGMDAYIMAGLLPDIGRSFDVPAAVAGQTVSVFTLCYAVSAPLLGAATAGKPARIVLGTALVIFVLANALSAVAPSYALLLLSRAVAGIGAGLFSPAAFSAAASLVPPERRGRALGIVIGGLAMGTAAGVPCGLTIADHMSWRTTLWLIAALGGLALAAIVLRLPSIATSSAPLLRARLAILADRRVAVTILVSFMTSAASIGLYTYAAALLIAWADAADPLPFLWAWSLGGLVGIYLCGSLIDATGSAEWVLAAVLVALTAVFLLLYLIPFDRTLILACFAAWGAAAWSTQTPQQHRLISLHPDKGSIGVALQSSAHYSGISAGSALGGLALAGGVPLMRLPLLAAVLVGLALIGQIGIALRIRPTPARVPSTT